MNEIVNELIRNEYVDWRDDMLRYECFLGKVDGVILKYSLSMKVDSSWIRDLFLVYNCWSNDLNSDEVYCDWLSLDGSIYGELKIDYDKEGERL